MGCPQKQSNPNIGPTTQAQGGDKSHPAKERRVARQAEAIQARRSRAAGTKKKVKMPRHWGQSRSKKMHPGTSKRKQCAATSHTALFIAVTRTQGSKPVVDLPALGWRRAADVPALGWRPIVDLPALGSRTVVDLPALGSRPVVDLPGLGWRPIFDLPAVL
jgi:hypothetical protein